MGGSMQADVLRIYVVYSGGGGGGGGGGGYIQGLSQDLETGCLKLAIVKFWGILFFKGDHNNLRLQPQTCMEIIFKLKKNMVWYGCPNVTQTICWLRPQLHGVYARRVGSGGT